jgi:hypothetical protein
LQLYPDLAYKSEFDSNGDPIPCDKFLVGIKTPGGEAIQIFGKQDLMDFIYPLYHLLLLMKQEILQRAAIS